jgi:hypothetical protein
MGVLQWDCPRCMAAYELQRDYSKLARQLSVASKTDVVLQAVQNYLQTVMEKLLATMLSLRCKCEESVAVESVQKCLNYFLSFCANSI